MIICENCGRTDETCLDNNISTKNIILTKEFKVKKWNMEIHGLCKKCNN
jgi:Fe2+ or Zn2+ uptake regulation protein